MAAPRVAGVIQTLTLRVARQELRALTQLSWPVLVGLLANTGMGVIDVAMVGHVSATDLAGVALGVSIWHIVMITLIGIMTAVNPLVAHHVGAGALHKIPAVVRDGVWMGLGVGSVALMLTLLGTSVFDHLAITPEVRSVAHTFLWTIAFALPAFAMSRALYGYCASLGHTRPLMVVALIGLGLSAFLNWCLVFGHLGFPAMGGVGCAWSNLISVWASLFMLAGWVAVAKVYRSSSPFGRFAWPSWTGIGPMMRLGLPIGVTYFAETTAFSLIALLVAKFGAVEVSAHQIALNCASLVFMVPMSLGVALLTRVGTALGSGDAQTARLRAWVGVYAGLALGVVSALGILLFRGPIANLYTNDVLVAEQAAGLLVFAAIFQVSDSGQVVVSNAIRAYKMTRIPMVIHLTAFWAICLPLGCWLGLAPAWLPAPPLGGEALKAQGFWLALIVGLSVAAVALVVYLSGLSRRVVKEAF